MDSFNLGLFIKEHRKQAGLTQLELANLAGVGKTTVFDIEKNKETVSWNKLLAVLKVLNIEIQFKSPIHKQS
ncbi:helix-turn-helix domain-containing protein [Flavobacterium taihuense]|uniref:Helix-turn-helix domain-containing protein n=1 Tax=Flavobacterium taihuense TaxID=2857508 RepID=A0ABS6XZB1_9FLAO|nr:helix-turn-helix domain-containing protein [Flavobacterium taihuense]MBW4362016.1 helix-turn-helix domain-containing protein [Flavobacterium taihuense]